MSANALSHFANSASRDAAAVLVLDEEEASLEAALDEEDAIF